MCYCTDVFDLADSLSLLNAIFFITPTELFLWNASLTAYRGAQKEEEKEKKQEQKAQRQQSLQRKKSQEIRRSNSTALEVSPAADLAATNGLKYFQFLCSFLSIAIMCLYIYLIVCVCTCVDCTCNLDFV